MADAAPLPTLRLAALSAAVVLLLFLWEGRLGFDLADEGYLWYGAQRTLLGEVPLRDFMSYDPGRYWWAAAAMALWGNDGILGLRASLAAFQVLGLLSGLWLVAQAQVRAGRDRLAYLAVAAAILSLWMVPRHKLIDIGTCLLLLAAFTRLVRQPVAPRFFEAGLAVGLAAVIGRNHGLYGLVGGLGVMAWLGWGRHAATSPGRGLALWALGIGAGYLPVIVMLLAVPGFASAFAHSLLLLWQQEGTNIALPVPWPWLAARPQAWVVGAFFLGLPLVGVLALVGAVFRRLRQRPVAPPIVAAACLSLPYAHFAFSRADLGHLAQGIFPALVIVLVLLAGAPARLRWPAVALLAAASALAVLPAHPGWQCRAGCAEVAISGDRVRMRPDTAAAVALLRRLAAEHAPGETPLLVGPYWPGAYALLGRRAAAWELCALFPRSREFELAEIGRLRAAAPGLVVLVDTPLDGDPVRTFRATHPLTDRFIEAHFQRIPDTGLPAVRAYRRRGAQP